MSLNVPVYERVCVGADVFCDEDVVSLALADRLQKLKAFSRLVSLGVNVLRILHPCLYQRSQELKSFSR